jgi:hypothetical protein
MSQHGARENFRPPFVKSKAKQTDYEGEILALGWNTESTSSNRMRADRAGIVTPWRESWQTVMQDVLSEITGKFPPCPPRS